MTDSTTDPRCPNCGEPIGRTATYCMHCSADLTEERAAADADNDGVWDEAEAEVGTEMAAGAAESQADSGIGATIAAYGRRITDAADRSGATAGTEGQASRLLAPDGAVDGTLTALVGAVGGLVVGVVGTVVLGFLTGSGVAIPLGFVAWLGATAYLVRRRTVQDAVAKSGYAVAVVLLSVPVVALSPAVPVDGGLDERGGLFVVLILFVGVPAAIAAAVGLIASRFVPDSPEAATGGTDGDGGGDRNTDTSG
ncbi:zinc-ribbon domain-containing protein [Haloplanus ruber]|uniref:Zinc-ribbon domain-containing protein n=1 Tax=Haloplanus ruber TaxID=869892 RepID=A0ABD6CYJ4_9EURY|nr:zinc-ribbon domain-containing protein [Haloplanus ruber]